MCRSRAQPGIDENEPSVADYSRSTDERQDCYRKENGSKIHISRRHGWNFYKGTVLLFLIAFSLLCGSSRADPEPCVVTKEGTHDCPFTKEQALFVEYGHPVTMFCYREWSSEKRPFSRDRQVSDFIILLNNKTVQPLTDFGPDEVRVSIETLPPSTNTFECWLKIPNDTRGDTELIYRSTITIGFKPKEPRNFKCASHNREKLVCTWDPEPNAVPTRFSLRLRQVYGSALICPASQAGSKIPPNMCVWDTSMDPPYNPRRTTHVFLLVGENILGKNSFDCFDFSYWENAIPPQPDNLLVLNITDSSALLRWSVSGSGRDFLLTGLHHRVSYQAQSDSQKTWHTVDITDKKDKTEIFFLLTDLEFADTVYNVRVYMKSSWAVSEDKWSQPAETIFKTAVSRQGPYTVQYHEQKQLAIDAFRPPKPKTVDVDRIGSDSVEVRWELPYSGRIDIVKGFNIYYCPALPSQNCTGPTIKTFVEGDQHLTVGTVRDLRPDTTYELTVAVLSENGEGLHSVPSYFTTTKAEPDLSSIEKTIRVAIEQSSSGIKDYVKDLMKQYKQNEVDELRSQINDSVAQVSNLGLTMTALNAKLDSHSESTRQRDEALDRKLNEMGDLESRITNATTQVSNLMLSLSDSIKQRDEALYDMLGGIHELNYRTPLDITDLLLQLIRPISVIDDKLDLLSDSFKQRDEALDDKLGGIHELNARINDSVTEVSNLGQTISAYKVELVSLSEENCQVRGNLTQCETDLADCFGRSINS